MGGTNLPGNHKLVNSISYDNAAKGIDSNSCPDVKVYSSTSYNNEGYNVALYTGNKSAVTDYAADGIISFRKGTDGKEQLALQSQSSTAVYGPAQPQQVYQHRHGEGELVPESGHLCCPHPQRRRQH